MLLPVARPTAGRRGQPRCWTQAALRLRTIAGIVHTSAPRPRRPSRHDPAPPPAAGAVVGCGADHGRCMPPHILAHHHAWAGLVWVEATTGRARAASPVWHGTASSSSVRAVAALRQRCPPARGTAGSTAVGRGAPTITSGWDEALQPDQPASLTVGCSASTSSRLVGRDAA